MNNLPKIADLTVFCLVARKKSFIGAADELGTSPAFISKRIQIVEAQLQCKLLNRSTRSVSLTEDGKHALAWASRIIEDLQDMTNTMSGSHQNPTGTFTITSSLGFGRQYVAPFLSSLITTYPRLNIRFDTIDNMVDLIEHNIDLDIRIGNEIAPNLIAKKLAKNRRILCAAPAYLAKKGTPQVLKDLHHHECLIIKERDHPFGLWRFNAAAGEQSIKVTGSLASNNGEMVRMWAMSGHGVMLRSLWDIAPEIANGNLVHVLPEYWQDADIWAVYPSRLKTSSTLRICIDFLEAHLADTLAAQDAYFMPAELLGTTALHLSSTPSN